MNMKLYYKLMMLITCFVLVGIDVANAVPAIPSIVKHKQSDGTIIQLRIIGDEFSNQILSTDGYALIGGGDGDYYYAKLNNEGSLIASQVKAKPISRLNNVQKSIINKIPKGLKSTKISPLMQQYQQTMQQNRSKKISMNSAVGGVEAPNGIPAVGASVGKLKSLVILVQYKDIKFDSSNAKQLFTNDPKDMQKKFRLE